MTNGGEDACVREEGQSMEFESSLQDVPRRKWDLRKHAYGTHRIEAEMSGPLVMEPRGIGEVEVSRHLFAAVATPAKEKN